MQQRLHQRRRKQLLELTGEADPEPQAAGHADLAYRAMHVATGGGDGGDGELRRRPRIGEPSPPSPLLGAEAAFDAENEALAAALRLSVQEASRHAPRAAPATGCRGGSFSPMRGAGSSISPRRRPPSPPRAGHESPGGPGPSLDASATDPESAALIRALLAEEEASAAERMRLELADEQAAARLALALDHEDRTARAAARAAAAERRAVGRHHPPTAGADVNAVLRAAETGAGGRLAGSGGRYEDSDEDEDPGPPQPRRTVVRLKPRTAARSRSGASSGHGSFASSSGASGSHSARTSASSRRAAATARAAADRAGAATAHRRRPAGGSALPPTSAAAARRAGVRETAARASRAGAAAGRDAGPRPAVVSHVSRTTRGPATALPPGFSSSGPSTGRAIPRGARSSSGAGPARGARGTSSSRAAPAARTTRVVGGVQFDSTEPSWDALAPRAAAQGNPRVFGAAGRPAHGRTTARSAGSRPRGAPGGGPALR